jgi:hypothetical protein
VVILSHAVLVASCQAWVAEEEIEAILRQNPKYATKPDKFLEDKAEKVGHATRHVNL